MNTWYVRTRKGEIGPFTATEIRFMIRTGAVTANDFVKPGETSAWMQLQDSTLIREEFAATTANAPPDGNNQLVPENRKSPEPPRKLPQRSTPSWQKLQTPPRLLPHNTVFHPMHRVAAAVVGILLLAILLVLGTVTPRLTLPLDRSSADNESVIEGTPLPAPRTKQAVAGAKTDAPAQTHEQTIASNQPVYSKPDRPAALPPPKHPPSEPLQIDEAGSGPIAPEQRFETGLPSVSRSDEPGAHQSSEGNAVPTLQGSDLRGRSTERRSAAIANSGGDDDSERSVAMALEWLKKIQQTDGSWSFQNVGLKAQSGNLKSTSAATTLAALCFLGAGNTTTTGPDADTVSRAFEFLENEAAEPSSRQSETLYVSALAMIAFSELAAMDPTHIRAKSIAASLLNFLQQSQDPIGGGWRYNPCEPGDLSVTGWQIMALQSAKTCGLDVSPVTVARCSTFVDSVAFAGGSEYSYAPTTTPTPCMSAVGLLSRIYLGSPKQSEFFDTGFQKLTAAGPDPNNIYLNYYASIALHHYGGPLWVDWNSRMRPLLVSQQIRSGPARGSWPVQDPWGGAGGQIYQTCLSTLCLEVYYRYLPMFSPRRVDDTENQEKP